MRGSVVRRGTKWAVVIELERDPLTDKRRQRWHSGYRTRKEAERARIDLLSKMDAGTYIENNRQTVGKFLDDWLTAIEPTVRASTFHSYQRNLRLHVRPCLGSVPLVKIDAGSLNALYARLLADGHRSRPGGLSPRTVRYIHTILHRAFKDGVRWGRLARNAADAADPPRASAAPAPEMRTWTADELGRFLDGTRTSRLYPAFLLLATTGMRRGEALGLRWADVNFKDGHASIRQTVITVNHETRFGTPKTAKGRRSIALDGRTLEALRSRRQRQLDERMLLGAGWRDHHLIFTKVTGEPLHPERFSREFDRAVQRQGLPKLPLHGLRHSWASLALQAGIHPKVVQERLGHATVGITLDTYSHVAPAMRTNAAETDVALVFGEPG
jgi:integrase